MGKGSKSYWYQYMRILPDIVLPYRWPQEDLELVQDRSILDVDLIEKETEADLYCSLFQQILQDNAELFPSYLLGEDLFHTVWAQVNTRCFQLDCSEYACLVPMGDAPNHGTTRVIHQAVNLKKHLEQPADANYFNRVKYACNLEGLSS